MSKCIVCETPSQFEDVGISYKGALTYQGLCSPACAVKFLANVLAPETAPVLVDHSAGPPPAGTVPGAISAASPRQQPYLRDTAVPVPRAPAADTSAQPAPTVIAQPASQPATPDAKPAS